MFREQCKTEHKVLAVIILPLSVVPFILPIKKTNILMLHRICGCVAFIAVLFVNTTHALELLTDYADGSDHGHSHEDDDLDHDAHGYGFVPSKNFSLEIIYLNCYPIIFGVA